MKIHLVLVLLEKLRTRLYLTIQKHTKKQRCCCPTFEIIVKILRAFFIILIQMCMRYLDGIETYSWSHFYDHSVGFMMMTFFLKCRFSSLEEWL